MSAPDVD